MSAPSSSKSHVDATLGSQPARGPVDQRGDGSSSSPLSGPEPPTAATRTAGADEIQSDAAATPPPAAPAILHRHALESIFAFLSLRDLVAALRVDRGWLSAVQSMRRLDLLVERPTAGPAEMGNSAAGRHVSALHRTYFTATQLASLSARMPYLRELWFELLPPDGPGANLRHPNSWAGPLPPAVALVFPAKLRLLVVDVSGPAFADAGQVNAAVEAAGRLAQLVELSIGVRGMFPLLSLAPLVALPRLRSLSIWGPRNAGQLSDAQVDQLRALPRLHKISVETSAPLLRQLLRQPHDLRWQQISLPDELDDEVAALLPQLPSLTRIDSHATCDRFEWLRGLPNLRDLSVAFASPAGAAGRAASLVAGLQCCTKIEILTLTGCYDLTAAHLADLLPRLPRLRELTLCDLRVDALSFLAQTPMTSQLSCFRLLSCSRLPPAELRHVHALGGLKALDLICSFTAPLDERNISLLDPPSTALPRLEELKYLACQ